MTVTPSDLYQQLRASGDPPLVAAAAVAIAGRESGYNEQATSGYRPNTGDYFSTGLFQINLGSKWGPGGPYGGTQDIHGSQLVNARLTNDPYSFLRTVPGSIAGFNLLYNADGLSPWKGQGGHWSDGTNLAAAAAASGGEVSLADLQNYAGSAGSAGEAGVGGAGSSTATSGAAAATGKGGCPEGNLVTFPSIIPNITRCEGRALLGAASLAAGALVIVFGFLAMGFSSKAGQQVISVVGAAK